jgi:1-deoxy-D-xylulose-5-phosphate reductoisomerase
MPKKRKNIIILGSTGSVGTQALDIIRKFPSLFRLVGISANDNVSILLRQIKEFSPSVVSVMNPGSARELRNRISRLVKKYQKIKIFEGIAGLSKIACFKEADIVLTAVSGSIGILPTINAIKSGKTVALANKEALVAAGEIAVKELAKNKKAKIIPVDSEHSAIFQCLLGEKKENVENLILTCSGGPFRNIPKNKLENVTVDEALNHPQWNMGKKITIDSATFMNKGLEVIEAHWLFSIPYEKIKVLIHPQSIVHSMVEFKDRTIKAQLGTPSMKAPIQLALNLPDRMKNTDIKKINLTDLNNLTFEEPDIKKYPCLKLAYEAGIIGGTMPAALNAANEVAVDYFLQGKIKFTDIAKIIHRLTQIHKPIKKPNLEDILRVDSEIKEKTKEYIKKYLV